MKESLRRFFGVSLGLGSLGYALWGAITGTVAGMHPRHSQWTLRTEEPAYFWITILALAVFGVLLIMGAMEDPEVRKRYLEAKKPWVIEIKRKPKKKL